MVHAVTTYKSYRSGTHKFIKSDVKAHDINPDALKVNAVHAGMSMMVS